MCYIQNRIILTILCAIKAWCWVWFSVTSEPKWANVLQLQHPGHKDSSFFWLKPSSCNVWCVTSFAVLSYIWMSKRRLLPLALLCCCGAFLFVFLSFIFIVFFGRKMTSVFHLYFKKVLFFLSESACLSKAYVLDILLRMFMSGSSLAVTI